jgi:hypothetical protein
MQSFSSSSHMIHLPSTCELVFLLLEQSTENTCKLDFDPVVSVPVFSHQLPSQAAGQMWEGAHHKVSTGQVSYLIHCQTNATETPAHQIDRPSWGATVRRWTSA